MASARTRASSPRLRPHDRPPVAAHRNHTARTACSRWRRRGPAPGAGRRRKGDAESRCHAALRLMWEAAGPDPSRPDSCRSSPLPSRTHAAWQRCWACRHRSMSRARCRPSSPRSLQLNARRETEARAGSPLGAQVAADAVSLSLSSGECSIPGRLPRPRRLCCRAVPGWRRRCPRRPRLRLA